MVPARLIKVIVVRIQISREKPLKLLMYLLNALANIRLKLLQSYKG